MALRVLHVYKDYAPVIGGIENHVRLLAEGQAARGLEVTVLVTNTSARTIEERRGGVRVVKAARLGEAASTPLSLRFFREIARLESDVMHLHSPYPPAEIGALVFRPRTPCILTYHSDVVRQRWMMKVYGVVLRRILRRADRIIAASANLAASSPFLRAAAGRCEVIPHGIDAARFDRPAASAVETIRRRHRPPIVLFVGRLRYYKGLDYLLQAMRDVGATLLVAGTGAMEGAWRTLAANLGLADRAVFLGDVPDEELPAYYSACEVFVLPASHRSEAFGLVQLEAMAARRPVVSTELGTGTSFVNVHGETGLVVPPRDPGALASAISSLLRDPDRRRAMGEAGGRRVAAEFSADRMIDRIIELYGAVQGRSARVDGMRC